jgi:PAS domain S-box-containing protein|tara:strand:+ start:3963 stop:6605 length:2643 start_codon:yes stop_codon:yes gene_type:complete
MSMPDRPDPGQRSEEVRHDQKTAEELLLDNKVLSQEVAELKSSNAALRTQLRDTNEFKQSEEELGHLFDLSADMQCITDLQGQFKRVNKAFAKTLGYASEELLHQSYSSFVHPHDIAATRTTAEQLKQGEPVLLLQNRYRCSDGSYKWISWTSMPIPALGVTYSVARDVTEKKKSDDDLRQAYAEIERKVAERTAQYRDANRQLQLEIERRVQSEETLQESEERLRMVFQASHAGAWSWDLDTGKFVWSDENFKLLGLRRGAVEPNYEQWFSVIYAEDQASVREQVEQAIEHQSNLDCDYRVRLQNGSMRWLKNIGSVMKDQIDHSSKMFGIQFDITDSKLLNEAVNRIIEGTHQHSGEKLLLELTTRLNQILATSHAFVSELLEDNTVRTVIYLKNGVLQENLTHPLQDTAAEKAVAEGLCVYADDVQGLFPKDELLASEQIESYLGVAFNGPDGIPVGIMGVMAKKPMILSELYGQVANLFAMSTASEFNRMQAEGEEKQLEAQLRQAMKMQAVGTLAGGIAHDFNNLLMSIEGNTALMLTDLDETHPHHGMLGNIETQVKRGADLNRQLLGFARGGQYDVKNTDLNKLLGGSADLFGRTHKEIEIFSKYQEDIWAVKVDSSQIEQVLLNLFINSWQAMPEGGSLYLQTKNVVLDKEFIAPIQLEPGEYVQISIIDDGSGMDRETQDRIFEPFFTTKDLGKGTGLGLASAYGIIKNHDGLINVQSELGMGTSFYLYLPATREEQITETKPVDTISTGTGTILFVDDEEPIAALGKGMLNRLGFDAYIATSGSEAIATYEEHKAEIDLVILDMIMPGMNGGEVYNYLKEINPEVKVILSSGYSLNEQAREIMTRGCNAFLQKPFSLQELPDKIAEVLAT